jgi:hypothetical protein
LSVNCSLPWDDSFIQRYQDKWHWGNTFSFEHVEQSIFTNQNITWSEKMLVEFSKKLNWDSLSNIPKIPWTNYFIEKYENNLNWNLISGNENLPWSLELLDKYSHKWNWVELTLNKKVLLDNKILVKFIDFWEFPKFEIDNLDSKKVKSITECNLFKCILPEILKNSNLLEII